jgi:hypothetical protein
MLQVHLPKNEKAKPKQVEVQRRLRAPRLIKRLVGLRQRSLATPWRRRTTAESQRVKLYPAALSVKDAAEIVPKFR